MNPHTASPAISVILVTRYTFSAVRRTVHHLRAQTIVGQLELILVGPSTEVLEGNAADFTGFASVKRVAVGTVDSSAAARAIGIQAATAPVVAFAEDHCYPDPTWAEEFVAAHADSGVAAVGPRILNANPASAMGWANFLLEYGPWLAAPAGDADHLPGHNSSYKRAVLLEYGDRLGTLLEAESVLHWELRERGWRLRLEPRAQARHVNYTSLRRSVRLRYLVGRLFAGSRVRGWPVHRRAAYALASPLIPAVRLWRTWHFMQELPEARDKRIALLPVLAGFLVIDAIGECTSYLFGGGNVDAQLTAMEFDQARHGKGSGAGDASLREAA